MSGEEIMAADPNLSFSMMVATGTTTLVLATGLAYAFMSRKRKVEPIVEEADDVLVLDRSQYPGGHLTVYFASQTGTAESFANEIQREGAEHGFFVQVIDLEDIQVDDLRDEAKQEKDTGVNKAIFLVSTYGEGEPTDNSAAFVTELKELTGKESVLGEEEKKEMDMIVERNLEGLDYCVFGLGNRQYEHYNNMSKFFDATLETLGGKRLASIGLGDDDKDLEGDFENWKDNVLWPTLEKAYLDEGVVVPAPQATSSGLPQTPYAVEYLPRATQAEKFSADQIHNVSRYYFEATDCLVTVNRELRSKEDPGSTVHMEIDISKAKDLTYQTADNLGVLPVNNLANVEAVAKALGYDLDACFTVKAAPEAEWLGAPFPTPCTIRECLGRYCDLTSAPRRSDLKQLASYASDPTDKKALLRMASKEGKAEYKEKIVDSHVGLVDLLRLCPSIEAPLEHFLSICPRLVPRYYTISSSSSVHPNSVHITVSVSETQKKDGSIFKGVCSTHLSGSSSGKETVRVFNRESTFRLPKDTSKPILMIGPGTGIAPMRALLQERAYQRDSLKKPLGPNVLYFGCKKQSMDYIYKDELSKFQKDGILTELHVAFSREKSEKVYVQHLLAQNGKSTWDLIERQGAYIYVCGGVKMGADVTETLKEIAITEGRLSAASAKEYLTKLASEGRFVQELWA